MYGDCEGVCGAGDRWEWGVGGVEGGGERFCSPACRTQ